MFLGFIFGLILQTQSLQFSLDWATFSEKSDSNRVEFYYGVPYRQLHFDLVGEELLAHFLVEFEMKGINNAFYETGSIKKRARIKSFQEAFATQKIFIDQFSILAPSGNYEIRATIKDSLRRGTIIDTITVPTFSEKPCLSSVLLGVGVLTDTATGRFVVIPNPGRRYTSVYSGKGLGPGGKRLYAYFEAYGLSPAVEAYELRYFLLSTPKKDTVTASPPITRNKTGTKMATTLELNIDSLKPGSYSLLVQLSAPAHGEFALTQTEFTIVSEQTPIATPYQFNPSPTEARYARELEYIATPRELAYYQNLSEEGKSAYLAWFWSKHNLSEFARRMASAEMRFRTARTPGTKTDRGRIYVKYGEPDAVERKTMEMEIKPREYWFYYQQGLTFVFIDLGGNGDFRLVWTNSPDEPPTGLENLLTAEEKDRFR